MALRLKLFCRRRLCRLLSSRVALATVFSIWFLLIFHSIYKSHDNEEQEANFYLHQRRPQQHHQDQFQQQQQQLQQHDFWPTAWQERGFTASVKDRGNVIHLDPNYVPEDDKPANRKAVPVNNGNKLRIDGSSNKKFPRLVSSSNKEYKEYNWNDQLASGSSRMVIVPGDRVDKPRQGEDGQAVKIKPASLSSAERMEYKYGWDTHKFNEFASKQISIQRDIPDFRNNKRDYDNISTKSFPKASIIICFYNEAWSVLLRSVHSVLLKSPPHLIQEIILVDDFSNLDDLKEPLDEFVRTTDKLRLLRMTNRTGLVRARLAGVDAAVGPVLIFLDSHIECGEGWLPPLLKAILDNPTVAVTPQIDVISDKTFSIVEASENVGIFNFNTFSFKWGQIMDRIRKTIKSPSDPFQSPTMAGGLFAIRKKFFLYLGTYDPNLALWGGENIELSLKLWLCGGGILTHPCSRVSHIFRDKSPYLTGDLIDIPRRNSARVAFVWADDYKKFFFRDKNLNQEDWKAVKKDVHKQMYLKNRLKCKPFRWFLDHVFPELHIEGSGIFRGPIRSSNGLCIVENHEDEEGSLVLSDCRDGTLWEMSRINEIRTSKRCLQALPAFDEVTSDECNLLGRFQAFEYNAEERIIYQPATNRCLTAGPDGRHIYCAPCSQSTTDQEWDWPINKHHIP